MLLVVIVKKSFSIYTGYTKASLTQNMRRGDSHLHCEADAVGGHHGRLTHCLGAQDVLLIQQVVQHAPPSPWVACTRTPCSEERLVAMRRRSPIAYVDKVSAATLVCLGSKDRRVPASQGIFGIAWVHNSRSHLTFICLTGRDYYQALRSRGLATKMMIFPEDVHAIDKPASEAEHWVGIAEWLRQHLL